MKLAVEYLHDSKGRTKAVQVSLIEWNRLMVTLKKYEQALKIKSDLKVAFEQVRKMKRPKAKKQSLASFLNEL